jgi:hypothetical protein
MQDWAVARTSGFGIKSQKLAGSSAGTRLKISCEVQQHLEIKTLKSTRTFYIKQSISPHIAFQSSLSIFLRPYKYLAPSRHQPRDTNLHSLKRRSSTSKISNRQTVFLGLEKNFAIGSLWFRHRCCFQYTAETKRTTGERSCECVESFR